MDFTDVARGRCTLSAAVAQHPLVKGLYLLTAPARALRQPVTDSEMASLLRAVRREFDFCLLDAPAGLGSGFHLATAAADRCVVVTTSDASSLRDAQHTVMELGRFPIGSLHLVVNRVRGRLLRHMHATIDDAIDTAGLPLLGVVPEDDQLPLCLNSGVPLLLSGGGLAAEAYRNIARRILGRRVPLMRIK
jgi:septum site-determining protein MinD